MTSEPQQTAPEQASVDLIFLAKGHQIVGALIRSLSSEDKSAATAALVAVSQKWREDLEALMEAALS